MNPIQRLELHQHMWNVIWLVFNLLVTSTIPTDKRYQLGRSIISHAGNVDKQVHTEEKTDLFLGTFSLVNEHKKR